MHQRINTCSSVEGGADARGSLLVRRKEAGLPSPCRQAKRCRKRKGVLIMLQREKGDQPCEILDGVRSPLAPSNGARGSRQEIRKATKLRADSEVLSKE